MELPRFWILETEEQKGSEPAIEPQLRLYNAIFPANFMNSNYPLVMECLLTGLSGPLG
jgi:hypothetical protein